MGATPVSITACILARNEANRIEDALRSLQGWTVQIIVIDNESEDRTVEIARRYTDCVLSAPRAANFDAARNLAIEAATGDWLFYLDADERVPPRLGPVLQRLVEEEGDQFEALVLPFKHYFCGQWMRHSGWWPGYTRPQLMKKGCFRYNSRLHSGAEVTGRTRLFPADDPELAIVHYSYTDLHHYLEKLNRYTDGEAESLLADGKSHAWQAMLAHFVHDWQVYYDRHRADLDGMHGFVLSFMSAFYRFASRAKLWDRRRPLGRADRGAEPVPRNLREALDFMGYVAQHGAEPWLTLAHTPSAPGGEGASDSAADPRNSEPGGEVLASAAPSVPVGGAGEDQASLPPISAVILARNEERRLPDALRSLQGWVCQVLLLDHGSTDRTAKIAREFGAEVIPVPFTAETSPAGSPYGQNFDALRSLALPHVRGEWVLMLDADERIPPKLAAEYVRLARSDGEGYAGIVPPFRNHFCGKWIRHAGWYPGYLHLQLLKAGRFRFQERLHGGIEVEGPQLHLPPDDPELAVLHHSYDDLPQYLEKLNRYTDAEAESYRAEGAGHSWQAMLAHFTHEWHLYYEQGRADLDGMHGFVLSFMSAFYRFTSRAKLWDLRRQQGELPGSEPVPANLAEMLHCMAEVLQHGPGDWLEVPALAGPSLPAPPAKTSLPLLWKAPLLDPSGYADEARNFVLGLIEAGEALALQPERWGDDDPGLPASVRAEFQGRTVTGDPACELRVLQTLPPLIQPAPQARFNIARTMFETDRLPAPWVAQLNRMDRVWVPSRFNRDTFVQSGVAPDKLVVLPGCIDPAPFAAEVAPWPLPGTERFRFLSVFDWTLHKGWDVLLEAFAHEFGTTPDVGLVLKVWSSHFYTLEDIRAQADAHLRHTVGRGLEAFPNIHLWWETIPTPDLPRLYRAADCFVLPTRGEGWGRPLMEAMAAGLPTLATGWSGLTQFHHEGVGYPLEYRLVPVPPDAAREIPTYAGHCWAEPDRAELRRLMREVVEHPEEARTRGAAAQRHIESCYSRSAVTKLLQAELARCRELAAAKPALSPVAIPPPTSPPAPAVPARNAEPRARLSDLRTPRANPLLREPVEPVDFRAALGRPLRVRWEGDQALLSSLALVNREFCLGLLGAGDVELSLGERGTPWHTLGARDDPRFGALFSRRDASLSGPPDVTVRHHFPPCWERPPVGKLVVIQPWEYGHLPVEWVQGALHQADEVWAYSRWVRDVYVRSGVPAEKVRVVPLGFASDFFQPEGPTLPLPTQKQVRFLFVGGALDRKGADLLLHAYREAFTPADDVTLIVKDMGTRTFYRGATFGEAFRQAQADPGTPEICYLDQDLTPAELAALYRCGTCVVQPYRGEGFALPPLEGMACGVMPIVTSGGPTDDYVEDRTGIRLPYRQRRTGGNTGGTFPCAGDPWQLEPDLGALVGALRWVRDHPEETRRRGQEAAAAVREDWTWAAAVALARHRLQELVCGTSARPLVAARPWSAEGTR